MMDLFIELNPFLKGSRGWEVLGMQSVVPTLQATRRASVGFV